MGKLIEKRPSRKPGYIWKDDIRMDLIEIGVNTKNWVYSTQVTDYWKALVNVALNLRFSVSYGIS